MDHVDSWGFVDKIISGDKTIESRCYKQARPPWNKIKKDDRVFFKNSGNPIEVQACVSRVKQFFDLDPEKLKRILAKEGTAIGIKSRDLGIYNQLFKDKKYCMLIFLKQIQRVAKFDIDKTGFGALSAWVTVDDISKIKR